METFPEILTYGKDSSGRLGVIDEAGGNHLYPQEAFIPAGLERPVRHAILSRSPIIFRDHPDWSGGSNAIKFDSVYDILRVACRYGFVPVLFGNHLPQNALAVLAGRISDQSLSRRCAVGPLY